MAREGRGDRGDMSIRADTMMTMGRQRGSNEEGIRTSLQKEGKEEKKAQRHNERQHG